MNLRDARNGEILWESKEDLSKPNREHEGLLKLNKLLICLNNQLSAITVN